jgi:hypothetical protein
MRRIQVLQSGVAHWDYSCPASKCRDPWYPRVPSGSDSQADPRRRVTKIIESISRNEERRA